MPLFHLAWVNPEDTTFSQDFARDDENVLSFSFDRQEGDFPTLTVDVVNPIEDGVAVGLLGAGRKQHVWFSYGEAPSAVPLFFGRIVAVPSSIIRSVVTLEFIARPADLNAQKSALAESLKVLPWYDPIFVDAQHRNDPDLVLEAYAAMWHFDPVTHDVTISDILIGEDGTVEFEHGDHIFDGLEIDFGTTPLTQVRVNAELIWTQLAKGGVDLTQYLRDNWPNEEFYGGVLTSFTLTADNWPKAGASLQDGWSVLSSSFTEKYDLEVKSKRNEGKLIIRWGDGEETNLEVSSDDQFLKEEPPGSIELGGITTNDNVRMQRQPDEGGKITSFSRDLSFVDGIIPLHHVHPNLVVAYDAARPFTENIAFTLTSDLQSIVTLPGDDEVLELNLKSVNLSEPLDPDATEPDIPIGDPKRRSYILSERGELSLQHLILRARAHLLMRSRAVTITIQPHNFEDMVALSLRKNALVHDWRIPGGQSAGKITGITISLNGDEGVIECRCKVECAIGKGGAISAVDGTGLYVDSGAMGPDLQEFTDRVVLIEADTSVGYSLPLFDSNDDGVSFHSPLTAEDIIQDELAVENPPATQRAFLEAVLDPWMDDIRPVLGSTPQERDELASEMVSDRGDAVRQALEAVPTTARFKLKSMKKEFQTPYEVAVTTLHIPALIDLGEADVTT